MMTSLRLVYGLAAALGMLNAALVSGSTLVAEGTHLTAQYWAVTIGVSVLFVVISVVLFGIGRHMAALGRLVRGDTASDLHRSWSRLALYLLVAGLAVVAFLALASTAIISRIGQGYAVFG